MGKKGTTTSRRCFMKTAAAVGAGVVFDRTFARASVNQSKNPQPDDWMVPKRPFGRTGARVPILGLGGMFDTGSNLLLLKQAVKWGVEPVEKVHDCALTREV